MSKFISISSSDLSNVIGGGNVDPSQVGKDALEGAEKGGTIGTVAGGGIGYVVGGARGAAKGAEIGHYAGMGVGAVAGAGESIYRQATSNP